MKVRFWGVRGSVPTPVTPQQLQNKISAVIQRITSKDIESPDARERFITNLPEWLYGTIGGNTSCVEIKGNDKTEILVDAGTGLRVYGKNGVQPENKTYNIFFSHFHWDHIQGLPFFDPVYSRDSKINFYSPFENFKKYLAGQQFQPYFPVPFDFTSENFSFNEFSESSPVTVGNIKVECCKMSHPGISYAYAFSEDGKKFVYATDVELSQNDFISTEEHETVFRNADAIVLDSQYTVEEAYNKENWGHSAFCYAIDFAVHWGIKKIFLFHHEPAYDDKKLNSILQSARWYAKYVCHSEIKVYIASENQEFEV